MRKAQAAREAEIVEELSQYIEDRYAELLASGATPEEAYKGLLAELSDEGILQREPQRVVHQAPSGISSAR
jgi:hypothetical protein